MPPLGCSRLLGRNLKGNIGGGGVKGRMEDKGERRIGKKRRRGRWKNERTMVEGRNRETDKGGGT